MDLNIEKRNPIKRQNILLLVNSTSLLTNPTRDQNDEFPLCKEGQWLYQDVRMGFSYIVKNWSNYHMTLAVVATLKPNKKNCDNNFVIVSTGQLL